MATAIFAPKILSNNYLGYVAANWQNYDDLCCGKNNKTLEMRRRVMNDIPEEIRKMVPDQPIHKLDIDDSGELHVLASAEPLSDDPHFENMPIERVNQYLQDHGYDPERVGLHGKILAEVLIENINLRDRAEAAERELAALKERARWIPMSEQRPPEDETRYTARTFRGATYWTWLPEPPEVE